MGKTVAVSFEGEGVRVVHASLKGEGIFIEKAEILSDEQFDIYLRRERSKEFVVTYDFKDFYHAVITTPPAKADYLEKIVESEIRKATGIKDLSFIYTPIGERIIENRRVMEVSYFAVRSEEIRNVVNRFYHTGKRVKALYPRAFSALPLFESHDEAILGVVGTDTEKTVFLVKKGSIYFIRRFKSLTRDLSDMDIHDINMTANYCHQNLRISPSLILLAGNLSESYNIFSVAPSVPLACLYKTQYIHCPLETFNDFIIPITSFYAQESSNILSREFKSIYMVRGYLANASRFFIIATILFLGAIFYEAKNIVDIKGQLRLAKKDISEIEWLSSEYAAKESEIKRYMPVVSFLSKPASGAQRLLIALGGMEMRDYSFNSIDAVPKDDLSFLVTINGTIKADTYTGMQFAFKRLTDFIGKIENVKIINRTMDITNKTFSIQMDYREGE